MNVKDGITFTDDGVNVYKNDKLVCVFPNKKKDEEYDSGSFPSAVFARRNTYRNILRDDYEKELLVIKLEIERGVADKELRIEWPNQLSDNALRILHAFGYKTWRCDTYDNKWIISWEERN